MSLLFNVSSDNIGLHIRNIFNDGELDYSVTEESSVVQKEGNRTITRIFFNKNKTAFFIDAVSFLIWSK